MDFEMQKLKMQNAKLNTTSDRNRLAATRSGAFFAAASEVSRLQNTYSPSYKKQTLGEMPRVVDFWDSPKERSLASFAYASG